MKEAKKSIEAQKCNEIKLTLKVLAQKYSISLERVRQLEENAILRLRESLTQA